MFEVRLTQLACAPEWPFARTHTSRLKSFSTFAEAKLWADTRAKPSFPDAKITIVSISAKRQTKEKSA